MSSDFRSQLPFLRIATGSGFDTADQLVKSAMKEVKLARRLRRHPQPADDVHMRKRSWTESPAFVGASSSGFTPAAGPDDARRDGSGATESLYAPFSKTRF